MMQLKIRTSLLLPISLALLSIVIYFCAPSHYVWGFDLYCGIHYVVSLIAYYISAKKKNYFDFDTLFLVSFFFVFFVYPIFLYPISEAYFFMFAYSFNVDVISKSTALALLGSQMYILGSVFFQIKKEREKKETVKVENIVYLPVNIVHYLTIILFILFVLFGGYEFLLSVYRDGESIDKITSSGYIFALFNAFFLVSIVFEFNKMRSFDLVKFRYNEFSKLFLLFVLLFCVTILSTGSRAPVLQTLLGLIGIYALLYRPISLKLFALLIVVGAASMSLISATRGDVAFEINSFVDLFMDLIINNRNTFTAVEYVDNNGITYGVSMLAYIFKVVPFLQGITCSIFNIDPNNLRSAMILTVDTLGANATWGLGTNIIADLYLAFGAPGVILFMSYLGYYVHKSEYKAKLGNIYYLLLYTVLISLSVYMVRSEFFYGLSLFIWSFCLINVTKHLYSKYTKI